MSWKKLNAEELAINKDNKLVRYGSQKIALEMDLHCKNAKKFYKTNLQKNIEKMDEICEKISEKIGKKCEYVVDEKYPTRAEFTIPIENLFPKQEDWELLENLSDSVHLISIRFPEISIPSYNSFYYTEEKNGTAMEANGEKITILPDIDVLNCDEINVEDFCLEELDEDELEEEDKFSYIYKSSIGKYGKILKDYETKKIIYPFTLSEIVGKTETLKTKKWEDKAIETVVASYKKLNEILTVVKPFAFDMKNDILKHKKMITNLKSKLRIVGE